MRSCARKCKSSRAICGSLNGMSSLSPSATSPWRQSMGCYYALSAFGGLVRRPERINSFDHGAWPTTHHLLAHFLRRPPQMPVQELKRPHAIDLMRPNEILDLAPFRHL